jgi:16S rRNA G966 N2-methylase RsmD
VDGESRREEGVVCLSHKRGAVIKYIPYIKHFRKIQVKTISQKSRIGLKDYFKMWKSRGWRLPFQYFFQNHLFDILLGIDTHYRLEKDQYVIDSDAFDSGVLYMSSLTNVVKRSLRKIWKKEGDQFKNFQFIDLGCGKGKSIIIYSRIYGSLESNIALGLDYYEPLIDIANNNIKKLNLEKNAKAIFEDARNYEKHLTSNNIIMFLYNPFGEDILNDVIKTSKNINIYIIYVDPMYSKNIEEAGYKLISGEIGNFPNTTVKIFFRSSGT